VTNSVEAGGQPAAPERFRGNAGRGAGKRGRLVAAARQVLYEQGVEKATLADIAAAAEVPLGNVYYYFKTKDALVAAVIDSYRDGYDGLSAGFNQHQQPADRLKAFVRVLTTRQDTMARFGCPVGSLGSELGKQEDALRAEVGTILAGLIDWAEGQFREMGRDDARELAVALIAAYEGTALLAAALRDPGLIGTEGARLDRWIDSLAGSGQETARR
jgi:TetR/AcrR family transcriptional regulator, transcriptional repressor for nem operon